MILFDFWRNSISGMVGSMAACFLLAFTYEGIKYYKDVLQRSRRLEAFVR